LSTKARALALVATLWGGPCFCAHPQDFDQALPSPQAQAVREAAESAFLKAGETPGRNQLLYLYELGALYQLMGDWAKSASLFDRADQVARESEGQALMSATGGLAQAGAALSNDSVLPWNGSCCDKVMSRTLNTLNYLAIHNLEGARVEVRKAEEYQVRERVRIQAEMARAVKRDEDGPLGMHHPALASQFRSLDAQVREVRNSYENAFTYFLSSQVHWAWGKEGLNDALVDIRRAFELDPQSPLIRGAYLDIAAQALDPAGLESLKRELGAGAGYCNADPAATGMVIVLFQAGLAPRLSEALIDLPISGQRFTMAFPLYKDPPTAQPALHIQGGGFDGNAVKVADVRLLTLKALQERMPGILARAALGAAAKIAAQKKVEDHFGGLGGFLTRTLTRAVTSADLRSWLSLPSEIQAARIILSPGDVELSVSAWSWTEKVPVKVLPGSTTFLTVRGLPGSKAVSVSTFNAPS
jgi:hypothetical protein